jgi:hypothetical protein
MISRRAGIILLIGLTVTIIVTALALTPIPQPLAYHRFADHRALLGIPNFGDVASNLPFALVGIMGMMFLVQSRSARISGSFVDGSERWPYYFVFFGLILTAFGSSYYHLAPDNARLVWDRLPMTIVFMSLVAAMIAERISVRLGLYLLPILLALGVASVVQWYWSELRGAGDLRFYGAVQVYSGLVLLLVMLFPPRYTCGSDLGVVVGFYALAKILETADRSIFNVGHLVSGHTLKHLAAAMAGYWILRMLQKRSPFPKRGSTVKSA